MSLVNDFLLALNVRMQTQLNGFCEQYHIGLAELSMPFQCFPIPFSDEIHLIIAADVFGMDEICIYDLTGRKVFAMPCLIADGTNEITLHPKLSAGVYVLKVGNSVQRIIKY